MMSQDDSDKKTGKKSRLLWTGFKILIFIAIFLFIVFTVMANLGGSSQTLKASIEEYISDVSGYRAQIGTLKRVSFFPMISFDFEDLELSSARQGSVAEVQAVSLYMDFFDVMFSTGKFRRIRIEGFEARAGLLLAPPIRVKKLYIDAQEFEEPFLRLEGNIGDKPVEASMKLERYGSAPGRAEYRLPAKGRKTTLRIGNAYAETMLNQRYGEFILEDLLVFFEGRPVIEGGAYISLPSEGKSELKADLVFLQRGSAVESAFTFKKLENRTPLFEGRISAQTLYEADFTKDSPPGRIISHLQDIFAKNADKPLFTFPVSGGNIELDFKNLQGFDWSGQGFEKTYRFEDKLIIVTPGQHYALDFSLEERAAETP